MLVEGLTRVLAGVVDCRSARGSLLAGFAAGLLIYVYS